MMTAALLVTYLINTVKHFFLFSFVVENLLYFITMCQNKWYTIYLLNFQNTMLFDKNLIEWMSLIIDFSEASRFFLSKKLYDITSEHMIFQRPEYSLHGITKPFFDRKPYVLCKRHETKLVGTALLVSWYRIKKK